MMKVDGKWTWSDGSSWEFENWASGQPDNLNGHQDYVQLNWQSVGRWDDMDVGANAHGQERKEETNEGVLSSVECHMGEAVSTME